MTKEKLEQLREKFLKKMTDYGMREIDYDDLFEWFTKKLEEVERDASNRLIEITTNSQIVMRLLEKDGASVVPHLIDNDDNAGERLRENIRKILKKDLIALNKRIDQNYGL